MKPAPMVTFTMRELDRLKVIQAIIETGLKPGPAAERLKELRLRGISTVATANAYAPSFMASYNSRFARPPKSDFNTHRPLRNDEDLDLLLTWREQRRVTKSLTVQYDKVMDLLDDTVENRKLIGRYIAVWEYPDGRIELRVAGKALAYRQYDRLAEVDQGAVVDNKRLGHALQLAQAIQAQRDNRRSLKAPARTNQGEDARQRQQPAGTKRQRAFTQDDVVETLAALAPDRRSKPIVGEHPGQAD